MRYWYDTEFHEDGRTIDLISIGIVAEDGREYYAVNDDADWDRMKTNKWLCENVIPHLPLTDAGVWEYASGSGYGFLIDEHDAALKPKWVIRNEVRAFLSEDGVRDDAETMQLWAYYGAYDHVALAQLFGRMIDLPDGIPMFTHDLMQYASQNDITLPMAGADEHDALADARWARMAHQIAESRLRQRTSD